MNIYLSELTENIEIEKSGNYLYLFVGKGKDIVDIYTNFIHKKPDIVSNIKIKAILFDNSVFNFFGNLRIENGAKNIDSYLKIDVLLMSPNSNTQAIPSLEVMEDSVKGGHGASIGPVDKEQLEYLMSRGLSQQNAEKIIAEGFVQDIIESFEDREMPEQLKIQIAKLR